MRLMHGSLMKQHQRDSNNTLRNRILIYLHRQIFHKPETSSDFISTSNSAVIWDTSFDGDLRPRRFFLEESHLRFTNVTWQLSVQGN